jgi:hypothetical protein
MRVGSFQELCRQPDLEEGLEKKPKLWFIFSYKVFTFLNLALALQINNCCYFNKILFGMFLDYGFPERNLP